MMWPNALWALLSALLVAGHLAGLQSNVGKNARISSPVRRIDYPVKDDGVLVFGRADTPECGVKSEGKKGCPLNLCCSKSGKCGVGPSSCNDCQKGWGSCAVPSTPKCGTDSGTASKGRHVAYYQVADSRRRKCEKKSPKQLNITGITHLNLAFATFDPFTFELRPETQADLKIYSEFTGLKSSTLQTWIAVGGWAFSEPGPTRKAWAKMTSSKENRAKFIASAINFMNQHGFQGIDLSWEFPSAADRGGDSSHDTANMISLAEELRMAISTRFGFSIALPSSYNYLRGIDPYALQMHVDWFNSMTYDLHGVWDGELGRGGDGAKVKPHTDLRDIDANLQLLWFNKINPKKVNLGLAYYSRAYTLTDKNCNHMDCDFSGPSKKGECSQFEGYLMNSEIGNIIKNRNLKTEMISGAAVKQLVWDDQWAAYEDWETLAMKVGYANELCLGGTFIWSLDYAAEDGSTPGLGTTSLPSIAISTSLASIGASSIGSIASSLGKTTSAGSGFVSSGLTNTPNSSKTPGSSSSSAGSVSGSASAASSSGNTVSGRSSVPTGSGGSQPTSIFAIPSIPIGSSLSGTILIPIWATGATTFPMTNVQSGTVWPPSPIRPTSTPAFDSRTTQLSRTAASSKKPKSWPTVPISSTVSGTVTIPVFESGFPMTSTTSNGVVFPIPAPQPTNTLAFPYCCILGMCDCPTSGATAIPTPTNSVDFALCCQWGLCSLNCALKNPSTSTSASAASVALPCCFWNLCTGCSTVRTGTTTATVPLWSGLPIPKPTDVDFDQQIKNIDTIISGLWGLIDLFKRDHRAKKEDIIDVVFKLLNLFDTFKLKIPGPPNSPAVPDCKPKKLKCGPLQFLCDLATSVVDLVRCIAQDLDNLRDMIRSGSIHRIEDLIQDIKDKLTALDSWDSKTQPPYKTDEDDPKQSSRTQPTKSSSKQSSSTDNSCSITSTVYQTYISCLTIPVTTRAGSAVQSCSTSTSTISGCDVTGGATMTVSTATCSPSTVYQTYISCFATPVPTNSRSTTQTCSTAVSTVSGCDVTGTVTASTSSAPACTMAPLSLDDDAGDNEGAPPEPTSVQFCSYGACASCDCTATAASTAITRLKRSIVKRAQLPNPRDPQWNGDVNRFIEDMHLMGQEIPVHPFTTYGNYPFGNRRGIFSVPALFGCTGVVVLSRKRVWIAHIFESPTFQAAWDSDTFKNDVLIPLEFGGGNSLIPQGDGIAHYASSGGDFENTINNIVHIMIITPNPRDDPNPVSDTLLYAAHVTAIHNLLWRVLNFDSGLGSIDIITYHPRNPLNQPPIWPWGKGVVMYDPFHAYGAGGCGIIAAAEVWFENAPTARYHDIWFAFPNQLTGAQIKREASACSLSYSSTLSRSRSVSPATSTTPSSITQVSSQKSSNTTPMPSSSYKPSSTTSVSSSSKKPRKTTPIPTPTPTATPKHPLTERWRIRFHQQMNDLESFLWWTLVDSNGEDAGNGQGAPIMAHPNRNEMPYEVNVAVYSPKSKENTNIHLKQLRDNGQCQAEWKMGAYGKDGKGDGRAQPWTNTCFVGPEPQELGCDLPTRVKWKAWKGGFERFFECWFYMLPR